MPTPVCPERPPGGWTDDGEGTPTHLPQKKSDPKKMKFESWLLGLCGGLLADALIFSDQFWQAFCLLVLNALLTAILVNDFSEKNLPKK